MESVQKYRESVEQQLESNREFHQRQVTRLRNEIDTKQKQIEGLRDKNAEVSSESDRIKMEFSALKQTTLEKDEKLESLQQRVERTDQAKNDLRGLEETGEPQTQPPLYFFIELSTPESFAVPQIVPNAQRATAHVFT